jgi:hypothetical protein
VARLEPDEARWRVSIWLFDHRLAERIRRVVLGPPVFREDPRHGPQDDARILDEFRHGRWAEIDRTRRYLDQGESRGGVRGAPVERAAPSHTRAADTADAASDKTWFEVKLVDEFGKGIDGLEVVFSQGSRRETLETDGNGVARWPDIEGPSFASVEVAKVAALRDVLKPRYANMKERVPTEGPDVKTVPLGKDPPGRSLTAEEQGILVITKPLTRVRLIGMHFDVNKCFLRESAMKGIRQVVEIYQANPTGKLLVAGHTDTDGDEGFNLGLSLDRAEAVKAYLKDDVAAWEAWFGDGKSKEKRWGNGEVVHMISALPCEKSIRAFQAWSNDTNGTSLDVDGDAGPSTRKALIKAYMGLDGTTLPEAIEAVVHGCGEYFPRNDEGDQFGKDGVSAARNRRVELFCFDDTIQPAVPGERATRGEGQYAQWVDRVTETIDVGTYSGMPAVQVRVYAPPGMTADLQLRDASGEITSVLLMASAEREGEHVTFDVDPYSAPSPLHMAIAYSGPAGHSTVDLPALNIPMVSI